MGQRTRARQGFTLIELMLVVAIIGILASISIPSYLKFQLRAKVGEAAVNMGSLAVAQEAYYAERGLYASTANPVPASVPGTSRVPWSSSTEFDEIGWKPEGAVLFQYLVSAEETGGGRFLIEAGGDIDGDGVQSFFGFVKPAAGAGPDGRLPGSTCVGSGVYTPVSGAPTLFNAPGPCDGNSGRDVF